MKTLFEPAAAAGLAFRTHSFPDPVAALLRAAQLLVAQMERGEPRQSFPALLAAVTAPDGRITGIHRTWLDPSRPAKAPVADPRRSLGALARNGVRFGTIEDVAAVGEGIETMLSLGTILPSLPFIAALSANLVDKARRLGIPVWRSGKDGGA